VPPWWSNGADGIFANLIADIIESPGSTKGLSQHVRDWLIDNPEGDREAFLEEVWYSMPNGLPFCFSLLAANVRFDAEEPSKLMHELSESFAELAAYFAELAKGHSEKSPMWYPSDLRMKD
jgi:hypothetical protein